MTEERLQTFTSITSMGKLFWGDKGCGGLGISNGIRGDDGAVKKRSVEAAFQKKKTPRRVFYHRKPKPKPIP